LTFRYERFLERQKDLEHKSNVKISEDVQNVQKILEALGSQREETDIIRQYNNNNNNIILHKTDEEKEQPNNNATYIDADEENAGITGCYKIKTADWYASLLMYNSY
jgi:hypothetical protein